MKTALWTAIFVLSLSSNGPLAYADKHGACDHQCAEKCEKGEHQDCSCKTCECSKGKACDHKKCSHPKPSKASEAPTESKQSP